MGLNYGAEVRGYLQKCGRSSPRYLRWKALTQQGLGPLQLLGALLPGLPACIHSSPFRMPGAIKLHTANGSELSEYSGGGLVALPTPP